MNTEALKSMMNPIRLKIVQEISLKGTATTKEIAQICGDIPQATLYRHLNALLKQNIIEVVSENQVRGILEKVYAIKENPQEDIDKRVNELSKQEVTELFTQFIISLLSDFEHYMSGKKSINIIEDKAGFRSYPLFLTDDEFMEMMGEIHESIQKRLENKPSSDRKLRKLSTITIPYHQKRRNNNES
ncbi:helix-turn-helix domain-containing protein [Mobilitalea sibirica]|uniref:Helix-turn-helix domain-containing protein n=1 Tax=Mobilitalea sibirica TaxID=1462919 RepID=A0A8J7H3Q4_9FIRM|nr:helix-turn-helix domain-containing protein [Mobilitalea sibirica]MBH1941807.1 helix-turn-helix domain-containing protein [Mobilitalea sibirica]